MQGSKGPEGFSPASEGIEEFEASINDATYQESDHRTDILPRVYKASSVAEVIAQSLRTETTAEKPPTKKPKSENKDMAPNIKAAMEVEMIMKQVEAAANRDIAIERYYEMSHEIKDEPSRQANSLASTKEQSTDQISFQPVQFAGNVEHVRYSHVFANSVRRNYQFISAVPAFRRAVTVGYTSGLAICLLIWLLLR